MMNAISCYKYEFLFWLLHQVFTTQQHIFVNKIKLAFFKSHFIKSRSDKGNKTFSRAVSTCKTSTFPPVQDVEIRLIVIFLFFKKSWESHFKY